jgi:hypothetical protein
MRLIRPLVLLGLLALATFAVQAQVATTTCTSYISPCGLPSGGVIIGGSPENPSTYTSSSSDYYNGENVIVGGGNAMVDANPASVPGSGVTFVSTGNQIFGNQNSLSSQVGDNSVIGDNNSANGKLGDMSITGNANAVTSDDTNIFVAGNGNTIIGTQGQNWGLMVVGGSNTITTSSGMYAGVANTVTNGFKSGIFGYQNTLSGANDYIFGNGSTINGTTNGTVLASGSTLGPDATNSVILGPNTSTDEPNVAEFGGLRVIGIANGVDANDGVAVQQLYGFANAFGAGSSFAGGVFVPPSFNLDGNLFNDTNTALLYLDGRINGISIPPVAPPAPPTPPPVNVSSTDPNAVHYDAGSKDASITLQGANGTTIHNLAAGIAPTDAANVGQVSAAITTAETYTDSQVTQAIQTANSYTDASSKQTLNWAKAYTDQKIAGLSRQISDVSAMSTAMSQQVATFAGASPENHNRIAGGIGMAGGRAATSIGYQHVSDSGHMAWNVGAAVGQDDKTTVGAGMGFSW